VYECEGIDLVGISHGRMSWLTDEWKDGLPSRALQKISQIENQLDKLKKERDQKQFQFESLEQV
jgi:centromere protein F